MPCISWKFLCSQSCFHDKILKHILMTHCHQNNWDKQFHWLDLNNVILLLNHFPYEGLVHLLTPGPMCHKSSSSFQRNNQGISHLSPSRFEAPNVILPIANIEASTRPRLRKTMDEAGCAQSKADGGGPRCAKLWRKVENADLTRNKFSTTPSFFKIGKFSSTKTLKKLVKKKMGKHWLGVLAVIELISPPPKKHDSFYSTRRI